MEDKTDDMEIEIEAEKHVSPKSKGINRGRKRKRKSSGSCSDTDVILPENALEFEKSVHKSAIKNNLDDESVKKILKKVVTNDHVLALVKIREQEEAAQSPPETNAPKLTRSKAKELMKVSPSQAPWSLELTPIRQLPVKTRPEVKALIAQELPEEEDDDEYDPAHDDVPSDDDQTMESCSDLDSQPRTPATPQSTCSPMVLRDGPFKLPLVSTPARRRLIVSDTEEEATIALRTRSKINLSETPIEHIENNFIPPDEIPAPRDEEWDQFVSGVFDPTGYREEDDLDETETDPEYNAAADLDANEEDDLDGSILRISRKELNDLVTELFSIMPEAAADDELASNLANNVLTGGKPISSKWEGKQEEITTKGSEKVTQKQKETTQLSVGKRETEDVEVNERVTRSQNIGNMKEAVGTSEKPIPATGVTIEQQSAPLQPRPSNMPPPLLQRMNAKKAETVVIHVEAEKMEMFPEQVQILQQQLRQHIQLAASNYLQLFINPQHWSLAPPYRQYLEQLHKIGSTNPHSVVNVCNLKPAVDLINGWEQSVSEDTPENQKMVEFLQKEGERARARFKTHCTYQGEFTDIFKRVVANSSVFLYPYLLPAMPYRSEHYRKFGYRLSEDQLLAIGLDQFWRYVDDNPSLFKPKKRPHPRTRYGLNATVELVHKYMFPWMSPKLLLSHILRVRKEKGNPVQRFFDTGEIVPVKHKLLPFNPELTLYEQPEHEMPRIWVRYLAANSKRFRNHLLQRKGSGMPAADGVTVELGTKVEIPHKIPLSIDFTKSIPAKRDNLLPKIHQDLTDRFDIQIGNSDEENNKNSTNTDKTAGRFFVANIQVDKAVENCLQPNTEVHINDTSNEPPNLLAIDAGKLTVTNNLNSAKNDNVTKENNTGNTNTLRQNKDSDVTGASIANNEADSQNNTMQPWIAQNMFRVVNTSTGSYLVPLTVLPTNDASTEQATTEVPRILSNDIPNPKQTPKKTRPGTHCKCCDIINKICSEKQTKITDYFKSKVAEKCQCSYRNYPRISKRLKLLISNFKSKICCVHSDLIRKMDVAKKECNGAFQKQEDDLDDSNYDLDDIAFVTSFQMKLMCRTNVARNNYLKKKVNNIFSKFDLKDCDVLMLTETLYAALEVDLIEMYKEFLAFLTPEQAERINKFKDYFIQSCVPDLVKRVEKEVDNIEDKRDILSKLSNLFFNNTATSCEMCTSLLYSLELYPTLAKHVFSLFPHRSVLVKDAIARSNNSTAIRRTQTQQQTPANQKPQQQTAPIPNQVKNTASSQDAVSTANATSEKDKQPTGEGEKLTYVIHYGEDTSDSDEESHIPVVEDTNEDNDNKTLTQSSINDTSMESTDVVTKTEIIDDQTSETTEMSELVMSEDEIIKSEPSEWRREEDKVILQVLLQNLTEEERNGKSTVDILQEKNLYDFMAESLTDKSLGDIKERVLYLLEQCFLSF